MQYTIAHTDNAGTGVHIIAGGDCVQRSRNLRGIITRAHKVGVARATCWASEAGGTYYIQFADGSWTRGQFADFTVCRDWFRARWRRWGLYAEVRNSDNFWSFI
jgi:hypothetical protein